MDIMEADTKPVNFLPPSPEDLKKSEDLESYLRSLGLYETQEEVAHREEALESLQKMCRESVKKILKINNCNDDIAPKELASLYTFGSFRMKINEPCADIDTMCVGPAYCDRGSFFDIMETYLKGTNEVTDVTVIGEAFVPIITMKYRGIEFDLSYAPINRYPRKLPADFNILDDENMRGMTEIADGQTVRSLNGRRVTDTILNIVPNKQVFLLVLKAFRYWARRRGLYKNVLGYLGGVNCALFCAYSCMVYPKAAPAFILNQCFRIFAEWEWPKPLILKNVQLKPDLGQDGMVWNPEKSDKDRNDLMPVLTPCYPSQNSLYNVMKSTRNILVKEFNRAHEVTEKILLGQLPWSELFVEFPFFTSYKYYIQVELHAENSVQYLQWSGFLESQMRKFIPMIENGNPVTTHLFPKSFEPPGEEFCRQFYIAFTPDENAKDKPLVLSTAVAKFLEHLSMNPNSQGLDVEITIKCLKNNSKINELPNYLFPDGKIVKRHRKRVRKGSCESVDDKKQKVNE